jgi:hypothetical protein
MFASKLRERFLARLYSLPAYTGKSNALRLLHRSLSLLESERDGVVVSKIHSKNKIK